MEYDEARLVLTHVVDTHVSTVDPAAKSQLSVLVDQGASNLVAQPERLGEARLNFEHLLRTGTEGPYDSPEPQILTAEGLTIALRTICPPPVFPICA